MKKYLSFAFIISMLTISFADAAAREIIMLDNNDIEKPKIEYQDTAKDLGGSLLINKSDDLVKIIDQQKEHDIKDLEILWKGTIENNNMIEFALTKLSTPESQRRIHSSLMAKTVSAIIGGASFVPSLIGTNYGVQTAAYSAGRIAQSLINRKNLPTETPLTDTELIELAGMVESLQDTLISSYYNYKNTLSQLKDTRSKILLYSKNYSNAIASKDILEISIQSARYDSMRIREFNLEQAAKKYHIQLQRLAGKKAVDSLELYQYDFDNFLYNNDLEMQKSGETKYDNIKNNKKYKDEENMDIQYQRKIRDIRKKYEG